jgi:hypothetical protein
MRRVPSLLVRVNVNRKAKENNSAMVVPAGMYHKIVNIDTLEINNTVAMTVLFCRLEGLTPAESLT